MSAADPTAAAVVEALSARGETIAVAVDPKNVVVTIPAIEREHPDSFISRVQRLPVPLTNRLGPAIVKFIP